MDEYLDGAIEFPICALGIDVDYLDCEIADRWNRGDTLSEVNQDLDLSIDEIDY